MSKPSRIPLFPDAYLRDNYRLSLEQHGLFLMLMMEAWDRPDCTLPDSEKELAEIAGITVARFRKIAPAVLERWVRENGRIYQKRLLKEWRYVQEKSTKRKAAANARWSGEAASKCNASAMHLGGGEGGGGGVNPSQEDQLSREGPFRVLKGGSE